MATATATATAAAPDERAGATGMLRSARSVQRPPARDGAREAATDALVQRMIGGFASELSVAARLRRVADIGSAEAEDIALALIDMPAQKRVLWVDDQPEGNRHEVAALAKLQIEVVSVRNTDEALARLDADREDFDLVLSDWSRAEALDGMPSAGLKLLRALAAHRRRLPVIFYHGELDPARRATRRTTLLHAGAFGEAVSPGELLALIGRALAAG
jgi:CheY-like chemotaxis protein